MSWDRGEGVCEFTFEVPDYEFDEYEVTDPKRYLLSEEVPGVSNGEWTCAHPTVVGEDTCPFHTDPGKRPDGFNETQAFLDVVDEAAEIDDRQIRRRRLQFVAAEFSELDLRGEVVGGANNQYINLTESTIGSIDCVDAKLDQPIRFANTTIEGDSTFRDAVFEGNADFHCARFEEEVSFRGAKFTNPVSFKLATFAAEVSFWYATFNHHGLFRLTTFQDTANFEAVDFEDYARFIRAKFCTDVTFELAEFRDDADFVEAEFRGEHSFSKAIVERTFDISNAYVHNSTRLDHITVEKIVLTPRNDPEMSQYVDLSESTIRRGELGQPKDGNVLYDLQDATLGPVVFTDPDGELSIDRIRFLGTKYDGFEFEAGDLNPQSDDWQLHDVFDTSLLPDDCTPNPTTSDLRRTYLNAKNGADQTGNNAAAGTVQVNVDYA